MCEQAAKEKARARTKGRDPAGSAGRLLLANAGKVLAVMDRYLGGKVIRGLSIES